MTIDPMPQSVSKPIAAVALSVARKMIEAQPDAEEVAMLCAMPPDIDQALQ